MSAQAAVGEVDPSKANATCVGPQAAEAGKAASCAGCPNAAACAAGAGRQTDPTAALVRERLEGVKHVILVLSGKGGVGKSTVAAQLAFALAASRDDRWSTGSPAVGLLDIDICGPSVPRMLGLQGRGVHKSATGWSPVYVDTFPDLGVMSVGFMLPEDDKAVIWRGPRKNGLIKQFLTEVEWGDLEYLVVDTPPGTSDEHISMAQYLKGLAAGASDGATDDDRPPPQPGTSSMVGCVVVTTPQEIAMQDVRKELNFCEKTGLPVLGIVENMAALAAPARKCRFVDKATGRDVTDAVAAHLPADLLHTLDVHYPVFEPPDHAHSAEAMARRYDTQYLGAIPLDPDLARACEAGKYFVQANPQAPAARPFADAVDAVLDALKKRRAGLRAV
mmetsp:Transcript_7483/g.30968  ORF Transcript_7483/g.30968 Transcript_7483/m.30968 type:complete len:390 (+) Transcript_7483:61-1230(+)